MSEEKIIAGQNEKGETVYEVKNAPEELLEKLGLLRKLPFVWELDNKGTVSYAIGTSHIVPTSYKSEAKKYISRAKNLCVELDIRKGKTQSEIDNILSRKYGEILDLLATDEQEEISRRLNMPLEKLRALPRAALPIIYYERAGYTAKNCVDLELITSAEENKIPIIELETTELQARAFKESMNAEKEKTISLVRKQLAKSAEYNPVKELIDAYMRGDESTLTSQFNEQNEGQLDVHVRRNEGLAANSLPYLEQPSTVAVGVAHFIMEPSILTLYKEHGIKIKRIK